MSNPIFVFCFLIESRIQTELKMVAYAFLFHIELSLENQIVLAS
jgi:hypothetical protein